MRKTQTAYFAAFLFLAGCELGGAADFGDDSETGSDAGTDSHEQPCDTGPSDCSDTELPNTWGSDAVDILVSGCGIRADGMASCCVAARADGGLVADLDLATLQGEEPWGDGSINARIESMPALWISDGSTLTGSLVWNPCALASSEAKMALHLHGKDPDYYGSPEDGIGLWSTYTLVYSPACD